MLDDALHAIVTAGTSLRPHPDLARLQADIIVDNQDIFRFYLIVIGQRSYALAAEIHISQRLGREAHSRLRSSPYRRALCDGCY